MRRRLFTILAGLSLVLCVATGVMWVDGYWNMSKLTFPLGRGEGAVFIARGRLTLRSVRGVPSEWSIQRERLLPNDNIVCALAPLGHEGFGGFFWMPGSRVEVPLWFVVLLFLTQPTVYWLVVARRRQRRERITGCCPKCGYDLRGNPAAKSCPECGAPIPAPPELVRQPIT